MAAAPGAAPGAADALPDVGDEAAPPGGGDAAAAPPGAAAAPPPAAGGDAAAAPPAAGGIEVEGFAGSLLEAIADGLVPSPDLLTFGDGLTCEVMDMVNKLISGPNVN